MTRTIGGGPMWREISMARLIPWASSPESFGEAPAMPATVVPLTTLQYLRTQLTSANNKERFHETKLNAPNGPICSGITKLSNLIHRQILSDEMHVSNLESLKDEFGISTTAATTPGLLKAILNCLYPTDRCYSTRPWGRPTR